MRIRTVKPDLFESGSLADTPIEARYLFIGLWTMADDEGRLRDLPKLIQSRVFPLDDEVTLADVTGWLDHLVRVGSLCRYAVDGVALLHIPAFRIHQVINRPTPSRLPDCLTHPAPTPASSRKRNRVDELLGDQPA